MTRPLSILYLAISIAASAAPATVILVRHADRASQESDSPLSDKGHARAQELKRVLADVPIDSIFVSEFKRTAETAEPIAAARNLKPASLPAAKLDDLVARIQALPQGSTALVVHHSNTVPDIVEKLGGSKLPPIAETEFDRLVIVILDNQGKARVLTLRYGALK